MKYTVTDKQSERCNYKINAIIRGARSGKKGSNKVKYQNREWSYSHTLQKIQKKKKKYKYRSEHQRWRDGHITLAGMA